MEYRSLRAAFQSTTDFIAVVPEGSADLLTVMDQALFFASHVVVRLVALSQDINIELQEVLLDVNKGVFGNPSDLLLHLQEVFKRAELLRLQMDSR